MNGFGLSLAFERVFERLLHERSPLRGFLFEEWLASRCRRGAEFREPRGEAFLCILRIDGGQHRIDEGRNTGILCTAGIGLRNDDLGDLRDHVQCEAPVRNTGLNAEALTVASFAEQPCRIASAAGADTAPPNIHAARSQELPPLHQFVDS